ncbi:MAG: hypothetical protein GX601_01220 [Anaerolineales bacterium]|nr:hypothetical protein [Anaerolineales bacterium]
MNRIPYRALATLLATALLASGCLSQRETATPTAGETSPLATDTPAASVLAPGEAETSLDDGSDSGAYTNVVSWEQAQEMILVGDIWKVAETHTRDVTLYVIDGRELITVEPQLGDVIEALERCGEPCSEIRVISP